MAMTDASLAATRDSYDALAAEHADVVGAGMDDRPLDRALFAAFAELVRAGGNGSVADVGCGAGRVTSLLSQLGLDAFGIDVSPGMVALARRSYPELRFAEGSMLALDLPAAQLLIAARRRGTNGIALVLNTLDWDPQGPPGDPRAALLLRSAGWRVVTIGSGDSLAVAWNRACSGSAAFQRSADRQVALPART